MRIDIFQTEDFQGYLKQILEERVARNPSYSQAAFARDLRMAPSLLSLTLNRKTSFSLQKAAVVAERLGLEPFEQEYFVALVDREKGGSSKKIYELRQRHAFEQVRADDLTSGLDGLEDFSLFLKLRLIHSVSSAEIAAKQFGADTSDVLASFQRLKSAGWIDGDEESGWTAARSSMRTEEQEKSSSIRAFHQNVLDIAKTQLHQGEVFERYFQAMVFSFKSEEYRDFCRELWEFCMARCDAFGTRESHNRIYTLGLHILPLGDFNRV